MLHSYDDAFVNSVVNTVATQTGAYHDAILKSIHASSDGFRLAEDAMNIYTRIASGTDTEAHIAIFLRDMLELANQGHGRLLVVSEEFRTIRSELLEVRSLKYSCGSLGNIARSRFRGQSLLMSPM